MPKKTGNFGKTIDQNGIQAYDITNLEAIPRRNKYD